MFEATFTPNAAVITNMAKVLSRSRVLDSLGVPRESRLRSIGRKILVASLGGLLVALLVALGTSGASIRPWQLVALTVLAYFSGGIAVGFYDDRQLRHFMAALLETTHPVTYSLTDDAVHVQVNSTKSSTPWSAVRRVLLADNFVFLLRDDSLMYVPTSAFPDEESMVQFTSYASERARAAA